MSSSAAPAADAAPACAAPAADADDTLPGTAEECTARARELTKAGDLEAAISHFSKALELSVAAYGDMDARCADAYYRYADAIVQKVQSENDPFGAALQKPQDADEDNDDDEDTGLPNGPTPAPARGGASSSGAGGSADAAAAEEEEGSEDEAEAEAEAEGPVGELQVAWECLETARVLFEAQPGKEAQLRAADCYIGLGDIRMENEDLEGAISDYGAALCLARAHLPAHDRTRSHVHYQLGVARQLSGDGAGARAEFEAAAGALRARVALLERAPAELGAGSAEHGADEARALREIIAEIEDKLDAEAEAEAAQAEAASAVPGGGARDAGGAGGSGGAGSASGAQPAADTAGAGAQAARAGGAAAEPQSGFGRPQLGGGAAADGFADGAGGAAGTAGAAPVSVLTVRRKQDGGAPAACTGAAGKAAADGEPAADGAARKKARIALE